MPIFNDPIMQLSVVFYNDLLPALPRLSAFTEFFPHAFLVRSVQQALLESSNQKPAVPVQVAPPPVLEDV